MSTPVLERPTPIARLPAPQPPAPARAVGVERRHLFTYTVGSALLWAFLAAITLSADPWYWWPVLPVAASIVVLALRRSTV